MLTGDKGQTAHNIAISCGLIDPSIHQVFKIKSTQKNAIKDELAKILDSIPKFDLNRKHSVSRSSSKVVNINESIDKKVNTKNQDEVELQEIPAKSDDAIRMSFRDVPKIEYSLLLDGSAVPIIMGDEELERLVREVFEKAASVVIYRCSPGGKAQIVELMKRDKSVYSLSIGDGGNDINMIQTAHIGIGIEGNEGS
jgi:phospholipid-translocating ATPase